MQSKGEPTASQLSLGPLFSHLAVKEFKRCRKRNAHSDTGDATPRRSWYQHRARLGEPPLLPHCLRGWEQGPGLFCSLDVPESSVARQRFNGELMTSAEWGIFRSSEKSALQLSMLSSIS